VITSAVLFCFDTDKISRLYAQDTFAPLITDNCVGMLYFDFRQVDLDRLKKVALQSIEAGVESQTYDKESADNVLHEAKKIFDKFEKPVSRVLDKFVNQFGIREIAFIADQDLMEKDIVLLAIKWNGKTDDDLKQFFELTQTNEAGAKAFIPIKDFLIMIVSPLDADKLTAVNDWTKNIVPAKKSPLKEALDEAGNKEIKFAFAFNDQIRKKIKEASSDNNNEIPKEFRGVLTFASRKIDWISVSISLGRFVSDTKKESINLTIKTPKNSDAVFVRNILAGTIDSVVFMAKQGMGIALNSQHDLDEQLKELVPVGLGAEIMGGFLRAFLPEVQGDKLVLNSGEFNESKTIIAGGVGVGVALLLPAVQAAREAARRMQCANNVKQITLALHIYHDVHQELPPLYTVDAKGKPLHSWRVLLLPYMEQQALYDQIKLDEPWDSEHNKKFHKIAPRFYRCPNSQAGLDKCHYSTIAGEVMKPKKKQSFADVKDGLSNTVCVVEVKEPFCWMDPTADVTLEEFAKGINAKDGRVGSKHMNVTAIGLLDGSVRFLPKDTKPKVLRALGTIAGGETESAP
jgi:hypothetical protein